ncbi:uncharacterized protein K489DRAFT_380517 [Dissoconium aciculare CBS 342.82]|uniref:C2H2-type domain-containing protein n=1 Tax=Dissoconium aciculare CBS 342.82 TaxID=1314786 RepID=A0A6J3M508_9PEZI|nr:uncharacterized protein K489DRAFT_380517 [Dissoconium aciculare CBS 342.82]KAF1823121.1 hypothetical protein K489DRAFT_380517 [Dissoconium aciculare CBS 342.82]
MVHDTEETGTWLGRDCHPSSKRSPATGISLQPRHAPPTSGNASSQPTSDFSLETQHFPDAQFLANVQYELDLEIQQMIDAHTPPDWLHGFDLNSLSNQFDTTTATETNPKQASPQSSSSSIIYCWDHGCKGREFSCSSNYLRHCREKSGFCEKVACPFCGYRFSRATARDVHLRKGRCKMAPVSARARSDVEPSIDTSPSSAYARNHPRFSFDTSTASFLERLGTLRGSLEYDRHCHSAPG